MIRSLFITSFLTPMFLLGQGRMLSDSTIKIKISETFWVTPGSYYVDSMQIQMDKTFLDPDNIKEVKRYKGENTKKFSGTTGATLITRKVKQPLASLRDIKIKKPTGGTSLPEIYIINGILIEDTSNIKIEITAIKSLDIINQAEKPEFYHEGPVKIIYILTTKGWTKKKKQKKKRN